MVWLVEVASNGDLPRRAVAGTSGSWHGPGGRLHDSKGFVLDFLLSVS